MKCQIVDDSKKIENPSLKAVFFVDIKTELGGIQYDYSENGDLR